MFTAVSYSLQPSAFGSGDPFSNTSKPNNSGNLLVSQKKKKTDKQIFF